MDLVTDGMKKVRLAESDAAINEERVVLGRRGFSYHARGSVSKLVGLAHDKLVERVAPVEPFRDRNG